MTNPVNRPNSNVRRALISVTHKAGIVDLATRLTRLGVEVISTGGTAKLLRDAGVSVVLLEQYTGSPEMLDGRVKTLHPKVHGGILARRDLASHREEVEARGIPYIDLVAVNLYDFDGAVAKPDATDEDIIENIDIGGPTLLRAAAKNFPFVLPLVDPDDYDGVLAALEAGRDIPLEMRRRLALKVYQATSRYDRAVSAYLERWLEGGLPARSFEASATAPLEASATAPLEAFATAPLEASAKTPPERLTLALERIQPLRYGENPHQLAGFYRPAGAAAAQLARAQQLQGKELSYNNILDLDSALGLVADLAGPSAVYIKHNNPCGVATRPDVHDAIAVARACDPVSAFGGVVAVNRPIDERAAKALVETFLEAVVAPSYTSEALAIFRGKANVRVLALGEASDWSPGALAGALELRQVRGGFLVQSRDVRPRFLDEIDGARVVTRRAPTDAEKLGLAFTWGVAKHVRSNAIVFGTEDRVVAVGAGQMSRVDSVKLCTLKAGESLKGTVVASDAFFPFRDGVDVLAAAGATAIVQPGGSIRDEEVIRAADEHGVAMIFTGVRHFRH